MSKLQVAIGVGAAVLSAYLLGAQNAKESKAEKKVVAQGDLKEFSVVYTDRAVNLMSSKFQKAMRDLADVLKAAYKADALALIPGSGSYAMEAAARAFGNGKKCLVIRNGYFSFRWSDIFEQCKIPSQEIVLKARAVTTTAKPQFAPMPIAEVLSEIAKQKPAVVFAPHVETATGIILPDSYLKQVADAVHAVGGLFVLDCIASGTIWVDMKKLGVDVIISAPQKGWSGPACVGIVMMNAKAKAIVDGQAVNHSGSFTCNLKKWTEVMDKYLGGAFMYYTTLPTDSLMTFRDVVLETRGFGFEKTRDKLLELGAAVRKVLESRGFPSVAAPGFQSPGVVVSYADDASMVAKFKDAGLQIAAGVPFMIDEPKGLNTFRLGLFGLDKIADVKATVQTFTEALDKVMASK